MSTLQPPLPNFDRVAGLYRWAEYLSFGPLLQRTRTAHMDLLSGCRYALLFGDGDGRFLARLLQRNACLHATAVDTSAAMLRLLRKRCRDCCPGAAGRVATVQGSALEAAVPAQTDLVVTHFFLDCLAQRDADLLAERVARAVKPGTLWLLSDFAVPAHPAIREVGRLYIRALYGAFHLLTRLAVRSLPDIQSSLARAGFVRVRSQRKLCGLLYSEVWVLSPGDERHNPVKPGLIHTCMDPTPPTHLAPADVHSFSSDAQPDPEPSVPSLSEPDPGIFHHEPGTSLPPRGTVPSPTWDTHELDVTKP